MKTLIRNARYFSGADEPSFIANVLIENNKIAKISKEEIPGEFDKTIDASGMWMTPGFIDTHTHYDAEVLVAPRLKESVRHGVTTAVIGCCSISIVYSEPEDCSDIFTRVEAIPREIVLPLLNEKKVWKNATEYKNYIKNLPLGPNFAAFIGHSDLRISTLGLKNAVDRDYVPTKEEHNEMKNKLQESLDEGFLGMSMMTTRWDKLDGDRFRSKPLPSTFARLKEFTGLNEVLRKRGRILQGAPDIVTKVNMFYFLWQSAGIFKKRLKTTLITLADTKANPLLYKGVTLLTNIFNKVLRSDFRWQALPCEFQVYADGMDLVVFEEFGAGEEALHLKDEIERNNLLQNTAYRKKFIADYEKKFSPRVWHRDFHDSKILDCPDKELIGKSFGEVALMKKEHPVEAFLNSVIEFGTSLRWTTTIANHRKRVLEKIISTPATVISFSDAGAHLRNMAFYNFPIQMLKLVNDAINEGRKFMSIEKAVWRLTGELADWFGINAGYIKEGDRADFVLIDPKGLNESVLHITEREFEEFNNLKRMVNNSDSAVKHVFISGHEVYDNKRFSEDLGTKRIGEFLEAK